jgi:glycosyltransferase involved in cell wall biosynthesis
VYASLLAQTFKDFNWLIVDDGSTDSTKALVDTWIAAEKIAITYFYKTNGGKYTAEVFALERCETKYFTTLDSDDAFVPEAVEVLYNSWLQVEADQLEDTIAEIRANSIYPDGKLVGNYVMPSTTNYKDATWHIMTLKEINYNEQIACWNLAKLKTVMKADEVFWLKEKAKFLAVNIWWSRLGRKYTTRYLNNALRIYYVDAADSWLRKPKEKDFFYNELVGYKYFLDENVDYFLWNPKYFFNLLLKFGISGFILDVSFGEILKVITSTKFKLYYIASYPLAFAGFLYYSKIKKSYWL